MRCPLVAFRVLRYPVAPPGTTTFTPFRDLMRKWLSGTLKYFTKGVASLRASTPSFEEGPFSWVGQEGYAVGKSGSAVRVHQLHVVRLYSSNEEFLEAEGDGHEHLHSLSYDREGRQEHISYTTGGDMVTAVASNYTRSSNK